MQESTWDGKRCPVLYVGVLISEVQLHARVILRGKNLKNRIPSRKSYYAYEL